MERVIKYYGPAVCDYCGKPFGKHVYDAHAWVCDNCYSGEAYLSKFDRQPDGSYAKVKKVPEKHSMEYAALKTIMGDDEDGLWSMMEDFGLC